MREIIPRRRTRSWALVSAALLSAACHHATPDPGAPNPVVQRLAAIAGQPLMIAPVQSLRSLVGGSNGPDWIAAGRSSLDSALTDTLKTRVGNGEWVYAAALVASFRQNPTYATDPRSLSVQPLRGAKLKVGDRLPEPLASQLRTMIALHEGRLVLLPIEVRIESSSAGHSRPVLQLLLVDPRASVIRWFGDVPGVESATVGADFAAPLASRVADLFVAK
jgi:hypothetical protein